LAVEPNIAKERRFFFGRAEKVAFAILTALLVWPYVVALRTPAVGSFNDDGIYVATAKALAEGRGYTIISLPHAIPQTKYPILFPLALAGVWKIDPNFPGNVRLLRLVPFLCALAWFWISFLLVRRETGSSRAARWVALLTAGLPAVVWAGTTIISETMFAALATAALLLLAQIEESEGNRPNLAAASAGILGGAAFLARTVGVALLAAGAISLGLRRKYRAAAAYAVLWILIAAPWAIWQRMEYKPLPTAEVYYSFANYKDWNLLDSFNWHQKAAIAWQNIRMLAIAPEQMVAIGPQILLGLAWVVTALALWGWLADQQRWKSSLWLFLPFYLGIAVLWAYPPARFLLPVMPLVLYYAWRGIEDLCPRARVPEWKAGTACVAVLVLLLANGLVRQARITARSGYVFLNTGTETWHQMNGAFRWVRSNTQRSAVFVCGWDSAMYLYTGRRAIRGYNPNAFQMDYAAHPKDPLGTTAAFGEAILREGVDYAVVVQDPSARGEPHFYAELFGRFEARYPGTLRSPVEVAPECVIYRVDRARLAKEMAAGKPAAAE